MLFFIKNDSEVIFMKYILKHPFLTGAVLLATINTPVISAAADIAKETGKDKEVKASLNSNEQAIRETWNEFDEYSNHFDLIIDKLANNMSKNLVYRFSNNMPSNSISLRHNIDITSTDKQYLIRVEVPGVEENDIKLQLSDNTLIIAVEKKHETEEKDKDPALSERYYGFFKKALTLPKDADKANIKAKIKNGLLTITVPRKETVKEEIKTIKIEKE
jgi:HSP20 family protein